MAANEVWLLGAGFSRALSAHLPIDLQMPLRISTTSKNNSTPPTSVYLHWFLSSSRLSRPGPNMTEIVPGADSSVPPR